MQRVWAYSKGVGLFKGCWLIQRVLAYSKGVGLFKGCGLIQRVWAYSRNAHNQTLVNHKYLKSRRNIIYMWNTERKNISKTEKVWLRKAKKKSFHCISHSAECKRLSGISNRKNLFIEKFKCLDNYANNKIEHWKTHLTFNTKERDMSNNDTIDHTNQLVILSTIRTN